ncbi:hypothetical protein KC19_1G156600 [Ceratodon purpureus]|uniref:Uncharacterized protein n=1 Tax=Ceratodon purpureus TaxID=3225 RepID=A0A8T0J8H6_CERPU|nr:hypothetical protein KC19_1G156600 [Ceratodon purpureus]
MDNCPLCTGEKSNRHILLPEDKTPNATDVWLLSCLAMASENSKPILTTQAYVQQGSHSVSKITSTIALNPNEQPDPWPHSKTKHLQSPRNPNHSQKSPSLHRHSTSHPPILSKPTHIISTTT